jgi:hypothetical protein
MKRHDISKLLGCSAANLVGLIGSKRESKGEMASTTLARIRPIISLTANLPPPIGWMSNNRAQDESSFAKAIR